MRATDQHWMHLFEIKMIFSTTKQSDDENGDLYFECHKTFRLCYGGDTIIDNSHYVLREIVWTPERG